MRGFKNPESAKALLDLLQLYQNSFLNKISNSLPADKLTEHGKEMVIVTTPKAIKHLMKDAKLRKLIERNGTIFVRRRRDYFNVLVFSVANQQLSGRAAATIYGRLKGLCGGRITPEKVSRLSTAKMRAAGFSYPKILCIKDLSKKFLAKEISPHKFHFQSNQEIIGELTKIKGIGRWTAEMFLMFSLGREDVFPADDLGIKNAIKKNYGLSDVSAKNLDKFSQRWKPYRTYASLYLWKSVETEPQKGW